MSSSLRPHAAAPRPTTTRSIIPFCASFTILSSLPSNIVRALEVRLFARRVDAPHAVVRRVRVRAQVGPALGDTALRADARPELVEDRLRRRAHGPRLL